jgi:hypothetical protein
MFDITVDRDFDILTVIDWVKAQLHVELSPLKRRAWPNMTLTQHHALRPNGLIREPFCNIEIKIIDIYYQLRPFNRYSDNHQVSLHIYLTCLAM